MVTDPYLPEPDSCHPVYARQAATLSQYLDRPYINVMAQPRRSALATYGDERAIDDAPTETKVLTVRDYIGPAPFIGDPRREQGRYIWRVAVDDLGRHVAGPATLEVI